MADGSEQPLAPSPFHPFPMQDGPPIPWCLAEIIYEHLYCSTYQSLERLGERGGFGWSEVAYMWKEGRRMKGRPAEITAQTVRMFERLIPEHRLQEPHDPRPPIDDDPQEDTTP